MADGTKSAGMATARMHADGTRREWAPTGQQRADFIEVTLSGPDKARVVERGHLENAEIASWIDSPRTYPKGTGGLRVLVCDRHRYDLEFPIAKQTFDLLVKRFKLPKRTRDLFECDAGAFSRAFRFDAHDRICGVDIILKAPQKREIGNYGLSMHYDLVTGVTTALLFGTDVVVCQNEAAHPPDPTALLQGHGSLPIPQELIGKELNKWHFSNIKSIQKRHYQRARPAIFSTVKRNVDRLLHPLALPCILLEDHIDRTREYCETGAVADATWEIMNSLGMRSDDYDDEDLFWYDAMSMRGATTREGFEKRFNAAKLTAKMDRQVLRILYSQRSPEWNQECSQFLLDLAGDIKTRLQATPSAADTTAERSHPASRSAAPRARPFAAQTHEEVLESLEYNVQVSRSVLSRLEAMRETMTLQLDVCASITGQSSNAFSARIAWDTSRDSTSMKILAVITAAFLPGTFVATFMSMGVWNWRWDPADRENGQAGVASDYWWVYLAAALPLTVITLVGWGLWWLFEIVAREKSYLDTQIGMLGGTWLEGVVRNYLTRKRDAPGSGGDGQRGGAFVHAPRALKNGILKQRFGFGKSVAGSRFGAGLRAKSEAIATEATSEDV